MEHMKRKLTLMRHQSIRRPKYIEASEGCAMNRKFASFWRSGERDDSRVQEEIIVNYNKGPGQKKLVTSAVERLLNTVPPPRFGDDRMSQNTIDRVTMISRILVEMNEPSGFQSNPRVDG